MSQPASTEQRADRQPAPSHASLDRSLVVGIAWTAGMKWVTQAFVWISTFLVARLLSPQDFGLVGIALVYMGLLDLISEFGLGAAIVFHPDFDEDQVARLGGASVLLGAGLTLASVGLAFPIARFFGERAVQGIISALGITFLISSFRVVPNSLLTRELRYRRLAEIDTLQAFAVSSGTLVLAVLGFRYWALVLGQIGGKAIGCALALYSRPHRLIWPGHYRRIASAVRFGWHVVVSRVAWYAYSNADFAIVGKVLGTAALGAYTIAWDVATVPVERVSVVVQNVTPPVLAAVRHDKAALRRYLQGLTEGLALLTFPASVGVFLLADQFVLLVLGESWRPAIMPLRLLACYGGFRSIMTLFAQILFVTDHSRRNMEFSVLAAVVLPLCFLAGSHWGTAGVAIGWLIGYPLVVIPFFVRYALHVLDMRSREYIGALRPALTGCLALAVVVLLVRRALPTSVGLGLRFTATVLLGAAAYLAALVAFHRDRVVRFLELWRALRGGHGVPSDFETIKTEQ